MHVAQCTFKLTICQCQLSQPLTAGCYLLANYGCIPRVVSYNQGFTTRVLQLAIRVCNTHQSGRTSAHENDGSAGRRLGEWRKWQELWSALMGSVLSRQSLPKQLLKGQGSGSSARARAQRRSMVVTGNAAPWTALCTVVALL